MTWNISLLPIALLVMLNGQASQSMTFKTASGGISTFSTSGYNSTSTAIATGSHGYLGTRPTAASRTRSGVILGTGVSTTNVHIGSGPCPTNAADYPSFVMPSRNPTESCDIYGPLCQTGSIAVGVKAADEATTTTVVPCSCYLTAQSLTVNPTSPPWRTGFGRSPQCYSFLQNYFTPSLAVDAPIFSSCPMGHLGSLSLNKSLPLLPDLRTDRAQEAGGCCGLCDTRIPRVRISFFPDAQDATCANGSSTAKQSTSKPSITPAPNPTLVHRALYPRGNASIAVSNGFTYTYPSIYIEFEQSFSMTDDCGRLGKVYPSTILAFPPGSVSTVSYDIALGQDFGSNVASRGLLGHTKSLNPNDLACPTWGLSGPYNPDTTAMPFLGPGDASPDVLPDGKISMVEAGDGVTIGPPFYPIMELPTNILTVDPAWTICHTRLNQFIPIFDPPRTLSVENVMDAPAGPPPAPPEPTPQNELVAPTSTSSPFVGQTPPEQPAPTAPANQGVQTGLIGEHADPTNANIADAGIPAAAVSPSTTPPPANAPAPTLPQNDPKTAAAENPASPVAHNQNPPANIPSPQQTPNLAAQLNAALAVSKSQAAAQAPASPPNNIHNAPAPNKPTIQQPADNPPPPNTINSPSSNAVAASIGAGAPPAATPKAPNPNPANSQAPAPAFAGVINNNDPDTNPGPPTTSSVPGLGGQILRPFVPATTAQSTVEVAPVPAGGSDAIPSTGAQVASNLPHNENSPQQQQPSPPANNDNTPTNAQSPPQNPSIPPSPPSPSIQTDNLPPNSPNKAPGQPPYNNPPASNPPQGQPSSTPEPNKPPPQSAAPPPLPIPNPPAINLNSQTYTRNSASAYVIASQTLLPGGAAVTVPNGDAIGNANPESGSGSETETKSQGSEIETETSTPTPTPIQISLASDGSIAIVDGSTQSIAPVNTPTPAASSAPPPPPEPTFTINGHPFILNPTPATAAQVTGAAGSGGITLTAIGQTVTIASAPVALGSEAGSGVVVVEGSGTGERVIGVPTAGGGGTGGNASAGGGVVIQSAASVSASGSASGSGSSQAGKSGAVGQKGRMVDGVVVLLLGGMALVVGVLVTGM